MLNPFRSLRLRLALTYIVVVGVILALFAAGGSVIAERQARMLFDQRLIEKADRITALLSREQAQLAADGSHAVIRERLQGLYFDEVYVQAHGPDGQVLLQSANIRDLALPPPVDSGAPVGQWALRSVSAGGHRSMMGQPLELRVAARHFPDHLGQPMYLQVASTTELLGESLAYMRMMFIVVIPMGLFAAGVAAWVVTDRAVGRLAAVARTARHVTADHLDERIASAGTDDEIDQVVAQINQMLGRLESSFTAHENFVANASHELRTPVAVLLTEAQIIARPDVPPEEYRAFVRSVEEEMRRLDKMIKSLLLLIRLSSGKEAFKRDPVSINDVVTEAVAHVHSYCHPHDITLALRLSEEDCQGHADEEPMVSGDEGLLQVLVENLLRNAVRFSTAGQSIEIHVAPVGDEIRLTVRDHGPGIPEDQLAHVFDRSRQVSQTPRDGAFQAWPSTGLGLSLCQSIVKVHGGWIKAANADDGGACFTVGLPCCNRRSS